MKKDKSITPMKWVMISAMGDENKVNAYVNPQLQQNHGKKVFLKSPKDVLERGRRLFGRRVTVVLNKDYSAEAA